MVTRSGAKSPAPRTVMLRSHVSEVLTSESVAEAARKYPALDDVKQCPAGRISVVPNQREKMYYQFVVCVADAKYADVARGTLTRSHARCFYCLSCDEELPIIKGKNKIGPHILKKHNDALRSFEENARREEVLKVSKQLEPLLRCGDSEQSRFEMILAKWVRQDMRPASIVSDPGFIKAIKFANGVQRELVVPSRQTVTTRIHTQAHESRLALRTLLSSDEECDFFPVSSDIWTSIKCESYISFTIHYVNASFDMKSWTLEVRLIPGKHDADAIANAPSEYFSWWRLDRKKCVRFRRDGASNIKKACSKLGLKHISCAAHSLHLVVGAALLMKRKECANRVALDPDGTVTNDVERNAVSRVEHIGTSYPVIYDGPYTQNSCTWMDDQLEAMESDSEDDGELDEVVSGADIDALFEQVAVFVADAEKNMYPEVSPADMESARKSVRSFRKLAEYFHRSQKGRNRLDELQSDRKEPLKVKIDCSTRWKMQKIPATRLNWGLLAP